jgi:hypothetical protein
MTHPEDSVDRTGHEYLGIYVPYLLWCRIVRQYVRQACRSIDMRGNLSCGEGFFDLELRNGKRIKNVLLSLRGELIWREGPDFKGPNEFTTEGLDFPSEDIVAVGIGCSRFLGFGQKIKWFHIDD